MDRRAMMEEGEKKKRIAEMKECSFKPRVTRYVPKSTYGEAQIKGYECHQDRQLAVKEAQSHDQARRDRIFNTRGMRQTEFGHRFSQEPRGRHAELPRLLDKRVSGRHDSNCRVCNPWSLRHAPDCRPCTPMSAYAVGLHKHHNPMMNYLPTTMEYVEDAYRNGSKRIPIDPLEDAYRRMKHIREDRAASAAERTLPW